MQLFYDLFSNVLNFTWQEVLMILTGGLLIYLAVKREMEPALLLPMGFGAILVNLPFAGTEAVEALFNAGIASELFPLLLFIGIGAMIDFGPLLSNPKMFLFGAAAQFGIFFTLVVAVMAGSTLSSSMPWRTARDTNSGNSTADSVVRKNFSTTSDREPLTWMSKRLSCRWKASRPSRGVPL